MDLSNIVARPTAGTGRLSRIKLFAAKEREAGNYKYDKQVIIGSSILKDVATNKGLYLATSWTCGGKPVLMHHQASMPYVLMYENRNNNIFRFVDSGLITLSVPGRKLAVGMMDGKDVDFIYKGETYTWAGDGTIRHKDVEKGKPSKDGEWDEEDFGAFLSSLPKCNPEPQLQ